MDLISRSAWGARPYRQPNGAIPYAGRPRGVKVHYLGTAYSDRPHDTCAAYVRQIQAQHMDGNGWSDIGYSFLVCTHGSVFEGRGLKRRNSANGNTSLNEQHFAVCALLGSSGLTVPPAAQLHGLRDAIEHCRAKGPAGNEIKGHRDGHPTACLPLDSTEVLTRAGWTPLGDVTTDHDVASWAMDSGVLSFDRPAAVVAPHEAETMLIDDFETTLDHNWVTYGERAWAVGCSCGFTGSPASIRAHGREDRRRGEAHETIREKRWKLVRADEMSRGFAYPRAVTAGGPGLPMTDDQLRLMVWLQGDGHLMKEARGPTPTVTGVEWHLKKPRKITRLAGLLRSLGIEYRENRRSDGTVSLRVYGDVARDQIITLLPDKRFHWGLLDMSPDQAAVFLDELMHVDGCEAGSYFSSSERVNLDVVQAVATINGRAAVCAGKVTRLRGGTERSQWRGFATRFARGRTALVGCLTTVNGTLIIRQNGRALVIGNCPGEPLYAWVRAGAPRPEEGAVALTDDDIKRIWAHRLERWDGEGTWPAGALLPAAVRVPKRLEGRIIQLAAAGRARDAVLAQLVEALASRDGAVDVDALLERIRAGIAEAVADVQIEVRLADETED